MGKISNQTSSTKEMAYTESKTLRNEAIENSSIDFLDKIKAVQYLTNDMCMSVDQIASYYDTSNKTISTIISRNREEFELDGMVVLKGEELKDFKDVVNRYSNENQLIGLRTANLTLLTKRSLLRVGLIMTNNAMATSIRNYLLNLEEVSTKEQKEWALQREVGKYERKRMTSAIHKYLPESKNKHFAYPTYTNLLYRILFNKEAKALREERNVKDNDALRDSFSTQELALVEEGETIITALLALSFTYEQIKEHLNNKYIKQLQG